MYIPIHDTSLVHVPILVPRQEAHRQNDQWSFRHVLFIRSHRAAQVSHDRASRIPPKLILSYHTDENTFHTSRAAAVLRQVSSPLLPWEKNFGTRPIE